MKVGGKEEFFSMNTNNNIVSHYDKPPGVSLNETTQNHPLSLFYLLGWISSHYSAHWGFSVTSTHRKYGFLISEGDEYLSPLMNKGLVLGCWFVHFVLLLTFTFLMVLRCISGKFCLVAKPVRRKASVV